MRLRALSLVLLVSLVTLKADVRYRNLTLAEMSEVTKWGVTEMYFQQSNVCWKQSYGNGAGVPLQCSSGLNLEGGACYSPCATGFSASSANPLCYQNCPAGFKDNGALCAKPAAMSSVGRSPAFGVTCAPGLVQEGGLCYSPCPTGFSATPGSTSCYRNCPSGYRDDGLYCAKPAAYGRGSGSGCPWNFWGAQCDPCPDGQELYGLLCYPVCEPNYFAAGCCVCSPSCPAGWNDIGVSCTKPSQVRTVRAMDHCPAGHHRSGALCYPDQFCHSTEFQSGLLCYPKCSSGYHNVGDNVCSPDCPLGFTDIGVSCQKPTRPRTIAPVSVCRAGYVKDPTGALCYPPCDAAHPNMVGPVCWSTCKVDNGVDNGQPIDCGALCASDAGSCATATVDMVLSPISMVADLLTLGLANQVTAAKNALTASLKLSTATIKAITKGVEIGEQLVGQGLFLFSEIQNIESAIQNSTAIILGQRLIDAYGYDNAQRAINQTAQLVTMMIVQQSLAQFDIDIVGTLDPTGIIGTISAFAQPVCRDKTLPPNVGGTLAPGQATSTPAATNNAPTPTPTLAATQAPRHLRRLLKLEELSPSY